MSDSITLRSLAVDCPDAADHTPPVWPGAGVPIQKHLDDLAATEAPVLAGGATRYGVQPHAQQCRVFADPAGHPFWLTTCDILPRDRALSRGHRGPGAPPATSAHVPPKVQFVPRIRFSILA
jgi:hypothetical protein